MVWYVSYFFSKFLSTIHANFTSFVIGSLNNLISLDKINRTYIDLVTKVSCSNVPFDFRPISLCNVIIKIITKFIVNRLKVI